MIRIILTCWVVLLAGVASAQDTAQDAGLHNSTKNFTDPGLMRPADWTDPAEMQRAWNAAIIRVPTQAGSKQVTLGEAMSRFASDGRRYPTVIYLHGCTGIWSGTHARMRFLAENGYLVIAPASLARAKYPMSCNPDTFEGGMYRETLKMRQADAGYAIEQVRLLPFVDGDRMALMGLSQGAITTATFDPAGPEQQVRARVVEGWTCTAGWSEYGGIAAPKSEPVLTLLAADDPWFPGPPTKGDCGYAIDRTNGSKSVIYTEAPMSHVHEVLDFAQARAEVLEFLKAHVLGE